MAIRTGGQRDDKVWVNSGFVEQRKTKLDECGQISTFCFDEVV